MDLAQRKRRERRRLARLRRALDANAARAAARRVAAHLVASPELARALRVVLYAALPDELPSRPLFEVVRAAGKRVLLPRTLASGELAFAECRRWEELAPGRYGVLEPQGAAQELASGDLLLVPGVAFDAEGNRLGRGGGYWDRALRGRRVGEIVVVGVGFAWQRIDAVPHGPDDQRVDAVLTECGWRRVARGDGA